MEMNYETREWWLQWSRKSENQQILREACANAVGVAYREAGDVSAILATMMQDAESDIWGEQLETLGLDPYMSVLLQQAFTRINWAEIADLMLDRYREDLVDQLEVLDGLILMTAESKEEPTTEQAK